MSFCLEFVSDEETHRVDYAKTPSYDAVAASIGALHGGRKSFAKYVDDDGDLCTFCADTFEDFVATARESYLPGDDVSARLLVMQDNPCDISDADLFEAWEHCDVEEFTGIDEEFEWVGEGEVAEASADSCDAQEELEYSEDVNHEPSQSKTPSENQDFKSEGAASVANALELTSQSSAENANAQLLCTESLDDTDPHPAKGAASVANALELTSQSSAENANSQLLCTESLDDTDPHPAKETQNDDEHESRLWPSVDSVTYISMSPLARFASALLTVPLLCSAPGAQCGTTYRLPPLIG